MKKLLSKFLLCCMVLGLMVSPVYAAEAKADSNVTVIEFSDGFTIEISTSTSYNFRANSTIGYKTATAKAGGREVGSATLIASFAYNGSTAWVTDTDYTKTTVNGCTYSHGGITTSGNRASMSGTFYYGGASYPFSISLTCSGSGTIS